MSDPILKMAEDPRWIEAYKVRAAAREKSADIEQKIEEELDAFRERLRLSYKASLDAAALAVEAAEKALADVEKTIDAERAMSNAEHPLLGKVYHRWKYSVFSNSMTLTSERAYVEVLTEEVHRRCRLRSNQTSHRTPRVGDIILRYMKLNDEPGLYYCSVPPALLEGKPSDWCLPGVNPNKKAEKSDDKDAKP